MNNLYNLGGALGAPAPPNLNTTERKASVQALSGESLPQEAVVSTGLLSTEETQVLIERAVSDLSDFANSTQRSLSFSVNQDTGDAVIIVSDSQTKEIVRQIPSEAAIQLAQNLNRLRETLDINSGDASELQDFIDTKGNLFDASV